MNRRQWITRSSTAAAGLMLVPPGAAAHPQMLRFAGTAEDPIRLHSNENPLGPSARAMEAMQRAMAAGWKYPTESYAELIEAIAFRERVSADHIFLGAGSHEVLRTAGTAYGIQGGLLVAPYPTYEAFGTYAEAAGAILERAPLDDAMETDLMGLESLVTDDTRLVFLCNPNNPTGRIIPNSDLSAFLTRIEGRTSVLIDEAYHEYVDDPDYASSIDLVRDGADIIVSRTFSKIYGLAGIRVGYAIAQPNTVRRLMEFRNKHSVSSVSVAAALASLGDQDFIRMSRDENAAGRVIVYQAASAAGMTALESHGNYVFVHIGEPVERFQKRMSSRGIRVGRAFPPYMDWARISIGTQAEMERFGETLIEVAPEVGDG